MSIWRVLAMATGGLVIVVAGWRWVSELRASSPEPTHTWFAPYVDVTLPPLYAFEDSASNPVDDTVLSFVVAQPDSACTPSWGGYFDLPVAADELELDRRVARIRARGGDVIVSFGGAANDELAVACTDEEALGAAYREVIDRYSLTTIDLDIEGTNLGNVQARERRARAIASLQQEQLAAGKPLAVWLTLPSSPSGLSVDGLGEVDAFLAAGVDLAGVNLMTMNFASSSGSPVEMFTATRSAAEAAEAQLGNAYRRAGRRLAASEIRGKLGITPMIGQNDLPGEVFTLDDARDLVTYVHQQAFGRLSMWSLNRDRQCTRSSDEGVDNLCSGIEQSVLHFTGIFDDFDGRATESAPIKTSTDDAPVPTDDPASSPYAIWSPDNGYPARAKVVWHREVYEAKWWTQGNPPDEPVVNEWDTPWRLLGPVLPGEVPATTTTVPVGTTPEWDATKIYDKGDAVWFHGVVYEAKWWTQGDQPDAPVANPWDSPWAATATP